ncbi:MAG: 2-C-methyl-D-erythritol 4-phosphate cytidylyltransferase [Rhodocyclaceae bacterium]
MHYALVPAAGSGSRFAAAVPKQYLPIAGRPLIHHALAVLCASEAIARVVVVLDPADAHWERHDWSELGPKLVARRCGGASRAQSVLNGLCSMEGEVHAQDWVLVHDAARPCLGARQLAALLDEAGGDEVGGILAVPLADTLKRADAGGRICRTLLRDGLWQAQTPQMFRYALLLRALEACGDVTDEAAAVEALGLRPKLVAADATNLKVTRPPDLALAAAILASRERE